MSLMKMIAAYDADREGYIRELEEEIATLKEKNNELMTLSMRATASSERKTLELIVAGHYDKFVKKQSPC